ncbi:MAG TPA: hypothetical protein VK787_12995, partial [Puia sp.]|nr:hypothetical protein [Puia sp.]
MILKKFTNELWKVVVENGFDANRFEMNWRNTSAFGEVPVIIYKGSKMEFWIFPGTKEHNGFFNIQYVQFLPTFPLLSDGQLLIF